MSEARLEHLRCADQDRELVAQVLNTAYTEGRLTFDEHADRIAQAYDAKTFGELNRLTHDLVRPQTLASTPPAPMAQRQPTVSAISGGYRGGSAFMSTLRPGTIPLVSSKVTLNAWLGDARIDFVGSQFETHEVTIHLSVCMGDLKIRVPEGVEANISGLNAIMADAKVEGIVPGNVRLNFVGTVIMGDVKIYGPALSNRRKYERFIR